MQPEPLLGQNKPIPKRSGRLSGLIAALLIVALAAGIFLSRQQIADQLTVWRFQPSAELQDVLSRTYLSDKGRFYVYASQAQIVDRAGFNQACSALQNEQTVVLGCYTTPAQQLYVYNVTDERLAGVRESTTAHEMLHAAYDRLGRSEQQQLSELLEAQAARVTDERVLQLIQFYRESEPEAMTSELHSIFGTEISTLSPELETYYAQYFTDRQALVAQQQAYEKVFTDLKAQQTALFTELQSLAKTVEAREAVYLSEFERLDSDIRTFNTQANGGTNTVRDLTAQRAALQSRITALENERIAINQSISAYNSKRTELEQLNVLAEDLSHSIDSTFDALPSTPSI